VRLGANVKKNEVIAIIDSREIAEAKSEYLAALVGSELQTNLYQREKGLFEKKITAENLYLKAKAAYTEAQLRLDLARQKLSSLDMSAEEIAHLRNQPLARLREKEIFAPITGKVLERLVNLGQPVSGDTQLYVIADLSEIELYLSVPIENLPELSRGQNVTLSAPDGTQYNGKIEIINPVITPETRMAKVIAYVDTPNLSLNPGTLLTAEIEKSRTAKKIIIPLQSVQTINNQPIVFVRTNAGFEDRSVDLGERDQVSVEVLAGLSAGEIIAMSNTHFLKTLALAEFGQK
jgi:cobalt-zinc-cadmium efflux system membrane fusion protein